MMPAIPFELILKITKQSFEKYQMRRAKHIKRSIKHLILRLVKIKHFSLFFVSIKAEIDNVANYCSIDTPETFTKTVKATMNVTSDEIAG